MSLTIPSVSSPTWARVDAGLYVVSRAGEYLGSVDRSHDGAYLAFDGRATPVGRYDTLREAKSAVLSVPDPETARRERHTQRVFQRVAAVSGVVAGSLALTAGTVVPFL